MASSKLRRLASGRCHIFQTQCRLTFARPRCVAGSAPGNDSTIEHLRHPCRASGEVFLIGTSHISEASAAQIHEVVKATKPSHVVIELCEKRRQRLEAERFARQAGGSRASPEGIGGVLQALLRALQMPGVDMGGKAFMAATGGFYALLRAAGLDPGVDMLAGIDAAMAVDAQIVCGDVAAEITAARLRSEILATDLPALLTALQRPDVVARAGSLGVDMNIDLFSLLRGGPGFAQNVSQISERLKDRRNVRELLAVAEAVAPRLIAAILHSRDAHIASLLRTADFGSGRVVCVVGLAHMDGIKRRYLDPSWHGDELP
eukprot:TRINITY_DN20876_c0_g1_i1.p1 TRINITY_DN20876_c0_g1~~TRINITY_DN20876_c0_g1_i1.p1  ORF type:complete len:354 (-),score=43.66 TRINITY_DN20876_c0_g1_i1:29-982(-)